ncbi:MAG TPA: hypothetical protein VF882_03565 [Gemmatimonadales bacterium]
MSRSTRALIAALVVSLAFAATACADATGPKPNPNGVCDYTNGNICLTADYTNGNI